MIANRKITPFDYLKSKVDVSINNAFVIIIPSRLANLISSQIIEIDNDIVSRLYNEYGKQADNFFSWYNSLPANIYKPVFALKKENMGLMVNWIDGKVCECTKVYLARKNKGKFDV